MMIAAFLLGFLFTIVVTACAVTWLCIVEDDFYGDSDR